MTTSKLVGVLTFNVWNSWGISSKSQDAFVAYLEWEPKRAMINRATGIAKPEGDWPMPKWGWGASRGAA